MKNTDPPIIKSQGFPQQTLGEFLALVASGTFGIHSMPCVMGPNGPVLNMEDGVISEEC